MTPAMRAIIRHLIGAPNFITRLSAVDAFVARESGGQFGALVELNDRPITSEGDATLRAQLMRRILRALEHENL